MPRKSELRYLRRDGNRMVRAKRRRRTALRLSVLAMLWVAGGLAFVAALGAAGRWTTSPGRFQLAQVVVRGNAEAREDEVRDLVKQWMGQNILLITLDDVERRVREHPWIGESGSVRISRRLPGTLVVTLGERKAGGLALLGGVTWLLDERGMPIDRFGPRYSKYDFPIIKGLDAARRSPDKLSAALADGVAVIRSLNEAQPAFGAQVSEIDVSEPNMLVLRLEGENYDLRLSRQEFLRNLENYFAVKDQIKGEDGAIEYVDLRWQDRIAVMPAADLKHTKSNEGDGRQ